MSYRIIPTGEWGARPPKHPIQLAGRPDKIVFHHTAGHWKELDHQPTESYPEAVGYVRSIQNFHMDGNGWTDTGQNFTVCRNGLIFEGRHGSLAAINKGRMVVSAHCPGQNTNPGVEIEHFGGEQMTAAQYNAAVWLFAYICKHTGIKPTAIHGHRDYFATACPGPLYPVLPQFRANVAKAVSGPAPKPPKPPKPKAAIYLVQALDENGGQIEKETRFPGLYLSRLGVARRKLVSFSGVRQ